MSLPGAFSDPVLDSRDLVDDGIRDAYEEGHDADMPPNPAKKISGMSPISSMSIVKAGNKSSKSSAIGNLTDIENQPEGSDEPESPDANEGEDPNMVFWDEPTDQDPSNPRNWPAMKKWGIIAVLSAISFVIPLASSMFAPGVPRVMAEFHSTNEEIASFVVSVYLLGWVFSPLVLAPLSEMYGRTPIYHITNILYIGFTVGCAKASSMGMLIGFRLLAGMVGATPLTVGAGTIADLMPQEKRGVTMAVYSLGLLLGPAIGPIIGGFLINAKGWRWVFWLITIMAGSSTVAAFILLRETYAPVILEKKVTRLRKSTGNPALRSKLSTDTTKSALIKRSSVRPLKLLFLSPIVLLLSTYAAVSYGILYLLFTTFTFVFEQTYHFATSIVGLAYIGIGLGFFTGAMLISPASDRILRRKREAGLEMKPEDRLNYLLTMPGAFCLPAGLFIYGWSADKHTHWIVPIVGTFFAGIGILSSMICVQSYLVDAFTVHAASAVAATTVFRSMFGAVLPLAGLRMNNSLGLGWSASVLAFVATALIPVPALFRMKGESIRTNPRFQVKL